MAGMKQGAVVVTESSSIRKRRTRFPWHFMEVKISRPGR